MNVAGLSEEKLAELAERRAAAPEADWDGVVAWVEMSLALIRPGGVLALVLPDGKPFTARRGGVDT